MHRIGIACLCLLCVPRPSQARVGLPGADDRQRKLETILRIQDSRRERDPSFQNLLSDRDSVVRERAALACGSLQDTTALPRLTELLLDTHRSIQEAAAFAIGQTGIRLSPAGRRELQSRLLGPRLGRTQAMNRIIEELGKFGTDSALSEILATHSSGTALSLSAALSMGIARFAIRGIVSDEAAAYLIRQCEPMENTLWQTVYALQRTGDHPRIRKNLDMLVPLSAHADPLVRMNLALLLGRFRGSDSVIASLQEMARYDADWRVRVNACRVLASADTLRSSRSLQTYTSALSDRNPYVTLAALSGLASGNWDLHDRSAPERELLSSLEALSREPEGTSQVQGEAAITLATLLGADAVEAILSSLATDTPLLASQLRALGLTGSTAVFPVLRDAAADSDPAISCAAIEGFRSLVDRNPRDTALVDTCRALAVDLLDRKDVAVTTTAASALATETLRHPSLLDPLLARLSTLGVPDDIEAIQEIARTLGLLGDVKAVPGLSALLQSPDPAARLAAREALTRITGTVPPPDSPLAPPHADFDFDYLRALPVRPRVTMETTRGTIVAELDRDAAPFTVMSFLKLALEKGFYDGTTFHRVVPNFVIQGGDPRGDGWGGPGYSIRSEFSPHRFETGILGIASSGKDTEGCQFFITHSPQPHLDGRYTIFGRVIAGQDVVERIVIGDRILSISLDASSPPSPGR